MCGSKPKMPEPPPPPPEPEKPKPFKSNEDTVNTEGTRKKKRMGTSSLTIPIKSGGLNT